jgi:8-oxo-dGTP diphosphatase
LSHSRTNSIAVDSTSISSISLSRQNLTGWYLYVATAEQSKLKKTQKKKPRWLPLLRFRKRRRGTAIVDTPQGILLVSEDGKKYDLPGGAAKKSESRRDAALRELKEETDLIADECSWLFECSGRIQRDIRGGWFIDKHKAYLMKVSGVAEPKNEINFIAYSNQSNVNLSYAAKKIIKKYHQGG